jgi:hypothetical protein
MTMRDIPRAPDRDEVQGQLAAVYRFLLNLARRAKTQTTETNKNGGQDGARAKAIEPEDHGPSLTD